MFGFREMQIASPHPNPIRRNGLGRPHDEIDGNLLQVGRITAHQRREAIARREAGDPIIEIARSFRGGPLDDLSTQNLAGAYHCNRSGGDGLTGFPDERRITGRLAAGGRPRR